VISCAGNAAFRPFADLTDADYALGLRSKLMGQVTLARIAKDHLRGRGIDYANHRYSGDAPHAWERIHFDGQRWSWRFRARRRAWDAAKLARQRGEPALGEGDDGEIGYGPTSGLASAEVAKAYVAAVEGSQQGVILDTRELGK
jgi:hypothetical protein